MGVVREKEYHYTSRLLEVAGQRRALKANKRNSILDVRPSECNATSLCPSGFKFVSVAGPTDIRRFCSGGFHAQ